MSSSSDTQFVAGTFPVDTFTAYCMYNAPKNFPGCFARANTPSTDWIDVSLNKKMSDVADSTRNKSLYAAPPATYKFSYLESMSSEALSIDMSGHGINKLGNMNAVNGSSVMNQLSVLSLNLANNVLIRIDKSTVFASSLLNLTLANNQISDFGGIASPALRNLNLRGNKIASFKNDTILFPNTLVTLDLSGNPITDFAQVTLPANLVELSLDQISTLQSIRQVDFSSLSVLSLQDTTVQNWFVSKDQFALLQGKLSAKTLVLRTTAQTKIKASSCDTSQTLPGSGGPITVCIDGPSDGSSNTTIYAIVGAVVGVAVIVVGYLFYRKYTQRRKSSRRHNAPGVSFSVFMGNSSRNSHLYMDMADSKKPHGKGGAAGAAAPGGRPRDPTLLASSSGGERYDVRFDPSMQQFRIDYKAIAIQNVLASGGFGIVHQAKYKGEIVAVKQLLPSIDGNSEAVTDFMEEIRLCSMLDHPHIVRFIGVTWTTLKDVGAVIEFMPNGDLANLVRQQQHGKVKLVWSSEEANLALGTYSKLQVLSDVASGLEYLHSFHIIHRDLKAKNVLLGEKYEAKLSDFGTSRSTIGDATMTAEVGTIAWIAPEVLKGKNYAESADMYSFGVLLSEVDTGFSPYGHLVTNGGSQLPKPVIAMKVMDGELRPTFTPSIPPEVLAIANQCLLHDPAARPTASQVGRMLADMVRSQTYSM
ncbi:Aste57867_18257 [Aphanomyces stellatus]|uniref:Aste57867_18257 protein n=1 Tax=Aphanomyces stellatus TaxID=120398 RepID=A0A485L9K9_9STRA|nr:hypothetical protein As57867_018195 [Aphanomyces stellatus]VFT94994.1 Aste57867_18257 [Aphanomyces stellatus]